jgi:hypothetical protein
VVSLLLKHEQVFVLAHLVKGNVSLCHHFSDLARILLSAYASGLIRGMVFVEGGFIIGRTTAI